MFILFLIISCGRIIESPYAETVSSLEINTSIQVKNSYPIVISLISDVHNNYDDLNDFLKKDNSDLIINAGDFTNLGLASEYNLFLKNIKRKNFISAVGNHDLLNSGEELFKKSFGLFNFSFPLLDYNIVVINNNNWESSNHNYYKEDLINFQEKNILISHVSPLDDDRFSKEKVKNNLIFMKKFIITANGHNHSYSKRKRGDTDHITIGSIERRHYVQITLHKDSYIINRIRF